jgi:hypothetical protein
MVVREWSSDSPNMAQPMELNQVTANLVVWWSNGGMPFTFSHPAAVLPIHSRFKKWIPLSALVIGSLVPDAAYYLPMPEHFKRNSHTLLGTFSSALPVGIFVLLIFYWIAPQVAFLLPSPHREVLQPKIKAPGSLVEFLMAASGIALGAETHVLWDSFTHKTGWAVERVPLLRELLWGNRIPVYLALEYLSSVIGLCILLYVYDRWMKAEGFQRWMWQRPSWRFYLWLVVFVGCFVAAIIESHTVHAIASSYFLHSRHFALVFLTSFVRNMLIALCTVSIGTKVLRVCLSQEPNLTTQP